MTQNAALAESQQQFDALVKSRQPQQTNRLLLTGPPVSSTHPSPQQLLHQQLNSQQVVQSQVIFFFL